MAIPVVMKARDIVIAYALFNILFVLCTGNLLEIGENMRFRFMTIPLFLVLCTMLYGRWLYNFWGKFYKML